MKKTITLILAASALTLALGATACNTGGISLGGTGDTPASSESVYGVSAATAGMLIQSMEAGAPDPAQTPESTPQTPETTLPEAPQETPEPQPTEPAAPDTTGSAFPELDGYMGLVDSFLNGSGYSVEVTDSGRAEYDEMMKISYSGLNGSTEYEMHYNKVLIPDFDDDWDDDRDDRWDDEEERNTRSKASSSSKASNIPSAASARSNANAMNTRARPVPRDARRTGAPCGWNRARARKRTSTNSNTAISSAKTAAWWKEVPSPLKRRGMRPNSN